MSNEYDDGGYEASAAAPVGGEREPAPRLLPIHAPTAEEAAASPWSDPNALAEPLGSDGAAGRIVSIAPSNQGVAPQRLPSLRYAAEYLPGGAKGRARPLAGESVDDPERTAAHLLGLSMLLIPTCSFIGYRLAGLYGAGAGTLTGGALVNLTRAAWSPGPERAVSITYGLVGLAAAGYIAHYAYSHKRRGIIDE